MKRFLFLAMVLAASLILASCAEEKSVWEPAVEQSTFTEMDQALPGVREAMMDLDETINKRITSKKYKEEALEQYRMMTDFIDILQFYYLPILNARAHIARAYREIDQGMYSEASDDIRKAVDNINKAALKSTESTKTGFDVVKEGLMQVSQISDQSSEASKTRLANAAKQLNMLIEKIKPVIMLTEEGESLVDGQIAP
ncbi:MAG: hypothetical protein ABIJ00_15555 [Candidatus Eisenbacteria bacterium]